MAANVMSRRPTNPAADRAAQNQQTLKNLVKLEGNKSCADCKRNKREYHTTYNPGPSMSFCARFLNMCAHSVLTDPRWASWNLGVFICIR